MRTQTVLTLKVTIFLIFSVVGFSAFAQGNDMITKIIINYGKGHTTFGEDGISGRSETIEIIKMTSGDFRIERYYKVVSSVHRHGKMFKKDTTVFKVDSFPVIPARKVEWWLIQMNTSKDNFNAAFVQPKLSKPTRNEIFSIAQKNDKLWRLKGRDADKEEAEKILGKLQRFCLLDSFMVTHKPKTGLEVLVIDSYNMLKIQVIGDRDTTEYQCQFFKPLGEGFRRYDKRVFSMNKEAVMNLEANLTTLDLIPQNAMARNVLDLNTIKEQYLIWYFNIKD